MKFLKYLFPVLFFAILFILLLQSCYSVRLRTVADSYNPAAPIVRDDYYRDMEVIEVDTTISLSLVDGGFTYWIKKTDLCPTGVIHTVEYRNTFGGILLSAVTFGRKRKVKIKYVCLKDDGL